MTNAVTDEVVAPPAGEAPSAPPETGTQPPPDPANEAPSDSTPAPTPAPAAPPAPSTALEPVRLTPEEWKQQQDDLQRQQDERDRLQRLKDMRVNAPIEVRDAFDEIQERIGTTIPKELRAPVLDKVAAILKDADEAARLALGDEYEGDREILRQTTRAFIANVPEAARGTFAEKVRGQDPEVWVKTLLDVAKPAIATEARNDLVTAQAALLPEGKVRDDFNTKAKGMTKPADIAQAFHDAVVGVVGPGGEPRSPTQRAVAGAGIRTAREAAAAYTRREITRDEYYNLRNTLP